MMERLLLCLFVSFSALGQKASISSAGSTMHYEIFGGGEPLLIINGGPGMNSAGFTSLAVKLSKYHKVILYDQRGTGKSTLQTIDESTITMDLMVTDIENLRKHLNFEKWNILGHSFGGMLASYYATKHPDRCDKLIMSSSGGVDLGLLSYVGSRTNSILTESQRDSLAFYNLKIAQGDTSFKARIGRGRALAPAYVYDKKYESIIAQRLTEGNSEINGLVWQNLQKINFDCAPKLKSFANPVLILQGKNDILKVSTAQDIETAFRNSKLVLLDNCGHYGWLDAPKEYFASIEKFLNS